MALITKFGFLNDTDASFTIKPKALGFKDNYAIIVDDPNSAEYTNVTSPMDQGELVSFKGENRPKVSTSQDILYPPAVTSGVQYVIKVEDILSTTSDTDANFRVDEPIVAYLTIRHPRSSNVQPSHIEEMVKRVLGACYKSDGTSRFSELMRLALRVNEE